MKTDQWQSRRALEIYAEVLADSSSDAEEVLELLGQLRGVANIFEQHHELRQTLRNSAVPLETKQGIVSDLLSEASPVLISVLNVMIERNELPLIALLPDKLEELIAHRFNIQVVDVTTAVSLDDKTRQEVKDKLATEYGKQIHLMETVDPSIIGGIILSTQGKRMDASVNAQLRHAYQVLTTETSGGEG